MEKKANLIGILGIVILLAISTMGSVRYQRVNRIVSESVSVQACLPGSFSNNFRLPQIWRNRIIPPVGVVNSLADPTPVCLPEESDTNFRLAHVWNGYYIPPVDVTGVISSTFKWNGGH